MWWSSFTFRNSTRWVLIARQNDTALLFINFASGTPKIEFYQCWPTAVTAGVIDNEIKPKLTNKARLCIAISSELLLQHQVELDASLSGQEQKQYIEAISAKKLGCGGQELLVGYEVTEQQTRQLSLSVWTAKTQDLTQVLQLLTDARAKVLRLESLQLSLCWSILAAKSRPDSALLALVELEQQTANFIVFNERQIYCRKTWYLDTNRPHNLSIAARLEQKVEQTLMLLNSKLTTVLYVSPQLYQNAANSGRFAQHQAVNILSILPEITGLTTDKLESDGYLAVCLALKSLELDV